MPLDRRSVKSAAVGPVAVAAEHGLVGESVGVALTGLGLLVVPVDLAQVGASESLAAALGPDCEQGLLITELDSERAILRARGLLSTAGIGWIVLTGAVPGPLWGAVLDAGARVVMPSSTSLLSVIELLRSQEAQPEMDPSERAELVESWGALWRDRLDKAARLTTLSRRERQVLRMLYRGEHVNEIAVRRGVTPATVRSQIKALLRKLGVNSQLAAVAVYSLSRQEKGRAFGAELPQASWARERRTAVAAPIPNIWETTGCT